MATCSVYVRTNRLPSLGASRGFPQASDRASVSAAASARSLRAIRLSYYNMLWLQQKQPHNLGIRVTHCNLLYDSTLPPRIAMCQFQPMGWKSWRRLSITLHLGVWVSDNLRYAAELGYLFVAMFVTSGVRAWSRLCAIGLVAWRPASCRQVHRGRTSLRPASHPAGSRNDDWAWAGVGLMRLRLKTEEWRRRPAACPIRKTSSASPASVPAALMKRHQQRTVCG